MVELLATGPRPVPDGTGPARFSHSQASLFDKCPRRWWFKYVAGLPDPAGDDARRGSLVHVILEYLSLRSPGDRTPDAAWDIATTHWTDEEPVSLRRSAWVHVMRALRLPDVVNPEAVATELKFTVELNGVPFSGAIDRVAHGHRGLVVTDWKDGKVPEHPDDRRNKRFQVLNYAAVLPLLDTPMDRPRDASLVYTAHGQVQNYPVTDKALAVSTGWLRNVWDRLQSARQTGEFPEKPSALCSWCPAVAVCPPGMDAVRARAELGKHLGEHGTAALASEIAVDVRTAA